jgi:4,5-DOPA dioxygenase extradiol
MDRKSFLKSGLIFPFMAMNIDEFEAHIVGTNAKSDLMPALFVGHGSPMNAIIPNEFNKKWREIGDKLPRPKAILCISAHWETRGTKVTAMSKPRTIHDFGGFPQKLFDTQYPAPGSPFFAQQVVDAMKEVHISKDLDWGLDHGCWSVLNPMFPKADIPTFQLSLDYLAKPEDHFKIALQLKSLRKKSVLILGSGNIVHNLGRMDATNKPHDWAIAFDALVKERIESGNFASLVGYRGLGASASMSIPTAEHYLPLLYVLAVKDKTDDLLFFNETIDLGSISMRSIYFGS